MRPSTWLLLTCTFPFLTACGSKPATTGETAEPAVRTSTVAAVKTDPAPVAAKPQELILGAWMRQKSDKGMPWTTLFPGLKAEKGMTLELDKQGVALFYVEAPEDADAEYTLTDDGVLQFTASLDGTSKEKAPPRTIKAKATITSTDLTLSDDKGNLEHFTRTKSRRPQFVVKPRKIPVASELRARLVGQWEMVKDEKKGVPWKAILPQFEKDEGLSLGMELAEDGKLKLIAPIGATGFVIPQAKYRLREDGTLEMITVTIGLFDGVSKAAETVKLKPKVKLTADELVLTDEGGGISLFKPVEWKWEQP